MKNSFTTLALTILFANCHSYAQDMAKLNFGAALAATNSSEQENTIPLLVQGVVSEIETATEQLGGTFRYSAGDISSILLKAKDIQWLAEKPFVIRIEASNPFSKTQVMNDTMLRHNRVTAVHAGTTPLTQAYKGDGVVVGIIDTGIDYKHPDFKDSNGKTRIKFLWDQVVADSVPPLPYNYGQSWTAADIDNGKATGHNVTTDSYYGHGSHVASVAAGNGLAINKYGGVAPNADIIFVAADLNNTNGIRDGVKYIYEKAALLGKPCVINISLGDYYGSHDGKNLEAQVIKNLITAQPGRSLVASAGNEGDTPFHLGYTVTSDTNFTWFAGGQQYMAMYSDAANFTNVKFSIGADKVTPSYSFRGRTPFYTITQKMGLKNDTIYNGTNRICTILSFGSLYMGVYGMEFIITPDTSSYYWRLMTTGTGKFDAWTFDIKTATLSDSTIYPPLKKYKQPDFKSNMVSSFQCLDEVIAVGNYTNRNQYIDYDTLPQLDATRIPGKLFPSSGHGPTRDGRIKPDVSAPGDWTMNALPTTRLDNELAAGNNSLIATGGFHSIDGGTSISSPGVAGIAALYLQKNPTAGWQAVKNAIIYCARQDSFTGSSLPNNDWGYGKADAFATVTGCNVSINNNPSSYPDEFIIYPNPASKQFTVSGLQSKTGEIIIYNVVGKAVLKKAVNSNKEIVNINISPGIYFCTFHEGGKIISTKKLIISE